MTRVLIEAATILIIGCFISIMLLRFMGQIMDQIVVTMIDAGIYDVAATWQTDPSSLINIFYLVCLLPIGISVLTVILLTQRKTEAARGLSAQEEFEVEEF